MLRIKFAIYRNWMDIMEKALVCSYKGIVSVLQKRPCKIYCAHILHYFFGCCSFFFMLYCWIPVPFCVSLHHYSYVNLLSVIS